MTAKQFSRALTMLGQTQMGFARVLGINERTVRDWVGGRSPVPSAVAMLVNLLQDTGTPVDHLRD